MKHFLPPLSLLLTRAHPLAVPTFRNPSPHEHFGSSNIRNFLLLKINISSKLLDLILLYSCCCRERHPTQQCAFLHFCRGQWNKLLKKSREGGDVTRPLVMPRVPCTVYSAQPQSRLSYSNVRQVSQSLASQPQRQYPTYYRNTRSQDHIAQSTVRCLLVFILASQRFLQTFIITCRILKSAVL